MTTRVIGGLLSLSLLVFGPNAFANLPEYSRNDSLLTLLRTGPADSLKIRIMNQLWAAYSDIDPALQAKYAQQAMELIPFTTNKTEIAKAYCGKSVSLSNSGQNLQAIDFDFKALRIFMDSGDSVYIVDAYRNLSIDYYRLGDFMRSIDYCLKAIELCESLRRTTPELYHNYDFTYHCNYNYVVLAILYSKAKDFESAERTARMALRNGKASNSQLIAGFAQEALARIFLAEEKADSALKYVHDSRNAAAMLGNEYLARLSDYDEGRIFLLQMRYEEAIEVFGWLTGENNNAYEQVQLPSFLGLARSHLGLAEDQKAIVLARLAYLKSQAMNNKLITMECLELLVKIHTGRGELKEATEYENTMIQMKDSLIVDLMKGGIASQSFNSLLSEQNKSLYSNINAQKNLIGNQKIALAVVAFVLLTGFAAVYLLRRSNQKQSMANEMLLQRNLELQASRDETKKMATSVIHDLNSPFNTLQGIYQLMEKEEEVKASQSVLQLVNMAKRVVLSGKELILQLILTSGIDEKDFVGVLKPVKITGIIERIKSGFLDQCRVKGIAIVTDAEPALVNVHEQAVTRILQNLVSNALKFSPHGSTIWLKGCVQSNRAVFEIIDQGPGFNPEDRSKMFRQFSQLSARPTGGEGTLGFGLSIVDFLVKKLEGSLELIDTNGHGAHFRITIPL